MTEGSVPAAVPRVPSRGGDGRRGVTGSSWCRRDDTAFQVSVKLSETAGTQQTVGLQVTRGRCPRMGEQRHRKVGTAALGLWGSVGHPGLNVGRTMSRKWAFPSVGDSRHLGKKNLPVRLVLTTVSNSVRSDCSCIGERRVRKGSPGHLKQELCR